MITNAGSDGHSALLTLFNASWEACKLPLKWKEATIIPYLSPKILVPCALSPSSAVWAKTMERIVLNRLTWEVGPLHQDLFAYRRGMGTAECLSTLLCAASSGGTTVAFLDLEKAFELANCRVILSLLVRKGVCGRLLIWLKDFLSGRAARVAFQGEDVSTPSNTKTEHHRAAF
ncbi:hypothetical protein GWK47_034066 [Chionoecetes opilio]|uniref:Reverse transcriptase domain-containing protein n=1 Tax=Chionoecetes opilio TaxID=41210 RepID=A0A8J5D0W5_CHIOP|nr:hypothetical protein GWK47_034066 [Chionoecetes opilio]